MERYVIQMLRDVHATDSLYAIATRSLVGLGNAQRAFAFEVADGATEALACIPDTHAQELTSQIVASNVIGLGNIVRNVVAHPEIRADDLDAAVTNCALVGDAANAVNAEAESVRTAAAIRMLHRDRSPLIRALANDGCEPRPRSWLGGDRSPLIRALANEQCAGAPRYYGARAHGRT